MVEEQVLARAQELNKEEKGDSPSTPGLQVEVIQDIDRFNSISSEWDRLVEACGVDRIFLSHTWFRTWWEAFGSGNELHVVTVRCGNQLVAAAPMMRTQASVYGLKVNALHAIYNPHTPRYDFIVGNDRDARLYEAVWGELIRHSDCEMIVLAQVPVESATITTLEELGKSDGWLTGRWDPPVSPFISLACEYDAFFNGLRSGCRFNLTKRYARLRRIGSVDMEVLTDRKAVETAMRDGLRIEAAAWKGATGTAILSDPRVTEFYIRLAQSEADLGQLRLTFLRVGGKRIAFNYLLENGKKLYAIKIGYDPEYHSYSPGNMLLNLILKDACARGIEEYDLLGGDDEWKFEWTKEKHEHGWLFLFRNRLRSRAMHYLKFSVVPALRRRRSNDYENTNDRNCRRIHQTTRDMERASQE